MAKKEINTTMAKSEYYSGSIRIETLQFVVPPKDNPHVTGYTLSGSQYNSDYFNIANELAEIEWDVDDALNEHIRDNNASCFDYDEKKLQKDLAEFVDTRDKADKMRWISFTINSIEGSKNGLMHKKMYAYAQYIYDLLEHKQQGKSLDQVKTPYQRQSVLKRQFSEEDGMALELKEKIKGFSELQTDAALKEFNGSYFPYYIKLKNEYNDCLAMKKMDTAQELLEMYSTFLNVYDKLEKEYGNLYGEYVKNLIKARENGQNLDTVKTPWQQKSLLKKLLDNEGQDNPQLTGTLKNCSAEEFAVVKELFKDGLPSFEVLNAKHDEYEKKAEKISDTFGRERRAELYQQLRTQYARKLFEDELYNQDYTTGFSSFIDEKEKSDFDKMSLKEITDKYGIQAMWTHKGVRIISEKIKQVQSDPHKLAETLVQVRSIVQQKHKCFHVPLSVRTNMFSMLCNKYSSLPKNPAYDKFSAVDNQFRKLFTDLKPQESEMTHVAEFEKLAQKQFDFLNSYTMDEKKTRRLGRIFATARTYKAFCSEIDNILDQSVDISEAKNRLLQQIEARREAKANGEKEGGVIVMSRLANAKESLANVHGGDFSATLVKSRSRINNEVVTEYTNVTYQAEVSKELSDKRTKREAVFAKKQKARAAKNRESR